MLLRAGGHGSGINAIRLWPLLTLLQAFDHSVLADPARPLDVCIPVFTRDKREFHKLFKSFGKFLLDGENVNLRVVVSNEQEQELFAVHDFHGRRLSKDDNLGKGPRDGPGKPFVNQIGSARVEVSTLQYLVSRFEGQSFFTKSGLANDTAFLDAYDRWSYSSLKKLYCGLTSRAMYVLVLDADSELVKPTNLTALIAKFYERGAPLIHADLKLSKTTKCPGSWPCKSHKIAQIALNSSQPHADDQRYFAFNLGYWWLVEPGVMRRLRAYLARVHGDTLSEPRTETSWFDVIFRNRRMPEVDPMQIYFRYLGTMDRRASAHTLVDINQLFNELVLKIEDPQLQATTAKEVRAVVDRYGYELLPHGDWVGILTKNVVSVIRQAYASLGVYPTMRFTCSGQAKHLLQSIPQIHIATSKQCFS